MLSDFEARLRRIEQQLAPAGWRLDRLAQGSAAASQAVVAFRNAPVAVACGTIAVTVTRTCDGAAVAGAAVEMIQDGFTVATLTTDGTGRAVAAIGTPGSYTVQANAPGYATSSASVSKVCGTATDVALALDADSAHVCCSSCPVPLPATLTLSDPFGSLTLTWNPAGPGWEGCHSATLRGVLADCSGPAPGPVQAALQYQLVCHPSTGSFQLNLSFSGCQDRSSGYFNQPADGTCSPPYVATLCTESRAPALQSCSPLDLVFPMTTGTVYGTGGANVTVTL